MSNLRRIIGSIMVVMVLGAIMTACTSPRGVGEVIGTTLSEELKKNDAKTFENTITETSMISETEVKTTPEGKTTVVSKTKAVTIVKAVNNKKAKNNVATSKITKTVNKNANKSNLVTATNKPAAKKVISTTNKKVVLKTTNKKAVQAKTTKKATKAPAVKRDRTATQAELAIIENKIFNKINNLRKSLGVSPLTRNSTLDECSSVRANECIYDYGHIRPNGSEFSSILTEYKYGEPYTDISIINGQDVISTKYDFGACGEILALTHIDNDFVLESTPGKGEISVNHYPDAYVGSEAQLERAATNLYIGWLSSQGHYNLMKNGNYKFCGVGVTSHDKNETITFHSIVIFTTNPEK